MNELGWNPARLAKESEQSKATISRITNYDTRKMDPNYRPERNTIIAIILALRLTEGEGEELFYTAYPEEALWKEAVKNGLTLQETDELLYNNGLPLLRRMK